MKNELYFENVTEIGNLFLEHIFLEFGIEPILFTCVNDHDKLYLCLCSEIRSEQKWVISECCINTLLMLIMGKIDMSSALRIPKRLIIITRDMLGCEKSHMINTCDIDPLDLPKDGTLLKCDIESAENYILYKKCKEPMTSLNDTYYQYKRLVKYLIYTTLLYKKCSTQNSSDHKTVSIVFQKERTLKHQKYCISKVAPYMEKSICQNFDGRNSSPYLDAA